jgi:hypothetical protein
MSSGLYAVHRQIEEDTMEKDLFGLTQADRMNAYAATKERFNLKAKQRDQLDTCASYSRIMYDAKREAWDLVELSLKQEGIIR